MQSNSAPKPSRPRLTAPQRAAIQLLRERDSYDDGWGVVTSDAGSSTCDGQPWINWRTVAALRRRGLVEVDHWDVGEARVRLIDRPSGASS